jgi:polyhydroxyalkanoate synthesis regulator phasin
MKKAIFAGLGVVFYTREKIEDVIKDMIHGGHLTRAQGTKILEELVDRGKEGKEELATRFHEEITSILTAIKPISQGEFKEVLARLEAIERHLGLDRTVPTNREEGQAR